MGVECFIYKTTSRIGQGTWRAGHQYESCSQSEKYTKNKESQTDSLQVEEETNKYN